MSCDISLVIPYKSVYSQVVKLTRDGEPIEFDGDLLFMVKQNETDPDEDAIISKTLTIVNTDGDPYHAVIDFELEDTSHDLGIYYYGFKTIDGEQLPTKTKIAEITNAIVQGTTA